MNHFEELKNRWRATIEAGRLEDAAEIIAEALAWAREHGNTHEVDTAVCAGASVAIQLGRGEAELGRLREILLRSGDPAICWLAAYPISLHYELSKNYKKSLFYARLTRDRAETVGRPDWLAYSHNQIGNAFLGESYVSEACGEYEKALDLMPAEPSVWRALALQNLGYCRVLQKRFQEGYTLLYQSLAVLRRFRARRYEAATRLDLCFAHLETGRYTHARRQGEAALRIAEQTDQPEAVKNALYLLGETESLSGSGDEAHTYFTRLQKDFFPDASYLPAFLMTVDVRKLINLHA
ncbi:MAG TPA: tetratricopeptide repeat protein [Thermoanaerobaculia bacterium]|jgi:tetratricopeptide (TPR) repeat protein|nr:tetratricopeptide repeat protein [Thermoanaerobaculia bacterium]